MRPTTNSSDMVGWSMAGWLPPVPLPSTPPPSPLSPDASQLVQGEAREPTTNSSDTVGRITGRLASPGANTARTTSRKGGRLVPARTDSELSVTFTSLQATACVRAATLITGVGKSQETSGKHQKTKKKDLAPSPPNNAHQSLLGGPGWDKWEA